MALGLSWSSHAVGQDLASPPSTSIEAEERARNSVELLGPLLELEDSLEQEIAARFEQIGTAPSPAQAAELEQLEAELLAVQDKISNAAAGVSEESYRARDEMEFDLNSEVESLIEPFVLILNDATRGTRELERTRRSLDEAEQRLVNAEEAVKRIEELLAQSPPTAIRDDLEERREIWMERRDIHEAQVSAFTQRSEDLKAQLAAERADAGPTIDAFRERATTLFMGISALFVTLFVARLLYGLAKQALGKRLRHPTPALRLGSIGFALIAGLAGYTAMLMVFNLRNDWLLVGLSVLLLAALIWLAVKTLPQLIEQLRIILNMGSVQETERVLYNGVPFRVDRLAMMSELVNPVLDGGHFALPVRELIGMHSRPPANDEAWFPSEKGDWVRLADEVAGQVIAQTPEMVVVEQLGGARVTYQTADYLAATPENLSHGYRVEIEFGIGFRHLSDAANDIIAKMNEGIAAHFAPILPASELRQVDVEFVRAGASSLDFEVEIDVAGTSADRFEELERELARCMIMLATKHGWEIPFKQVVVHNASERAQA